MGEARVQQFKVQKFLLLHPRCIYCGDKATTVDHCPPKCFFDGRQWPESYEFPACKKCNNEARLDEQALGVLVRVEVFRRKKRSGSDEWKKLLRGTVNNWPQIVAEWKEVSRNRQRRVLRDMFGDLGDEMRRAGFGTINVGPITRSAIKRFVVKLAKALYYRHTGEILDGVVHASQLSSLDSEKYGDLIDSALKFAPALADSKRSGKTLYD